MKRLLCTALLSLSCVAAYAEWQVVSEGTGGKVYVDFDRSVREKDSTKIWALIDFKSQRETDEEKKVSYLSVLIHFEFDCRKRLAKQTRTLYFSESMGSGKQVDSSWGRGFFDDIVPNTLDEMVFNSVCKQRKN